MDALTPSQRQPSPAELSTIEALVNSPTRLAALERSGLMDSVPEESFDSLTRLAARLVKVPASFVAIVAADRDFYKSQTGFPAPLCDTRELSGRTFCHFTLDSDGPLVIDDTHNDAVWRAVPTVDAIGVRAYIGVPIKLDGETIGSFCVIDMKPREWQPEELETVNQLALSAGREIRLRAALAASKNEALKSQALARAREEVVAVVAHDLRTPLQVIQLSTKRLQKTANAHDASTMQRMLRAVDSIKSMAEALLASALLVPSTAGRKQIMGGALLQDAIDMMTPIAERCGIALDLGGVADANVHVDYAQMLRVLGNLIGNALKYSPPGSAVVVGGRLDGGSFLITVRDNGKGMDTSEQSRAFDSGWQGAEGMLRGDGAGLGLSIARTLVAEHGGIIELASAVSHGTTVTITLPVNDSPFSRPQT